MGGPLSRYRVVTPSGAESVIKYNAHDAEQAGLTDADLVDAVPPAAADTDGGSAPPAKRRSTAANKARSTAANKGSRRAAPADGSPPAGPSPAPGDDDGGPDGDG